MEFYFTQTLGSFSSYWIGLRQSWALSPGSGTWSGGGFGWEDNATSAPTEVASRLATLNSPGYSHWVKFSSQAPEPNGQACAYAEVGALRPLPVACGCSPGLCCDVVDVCGILTQMPR